MFPVDWRWIVFSLASTPAIYYLICVFESRRFFTRERQAGPGPSACAPSVSILKPVRGLDREAYENFASFCRLDYPRYEILFAVGDLYDPAVPIIEQLIADFPQCAIRLVVGAERLGTNDKICKLVQLAREARFDILVATDSDVRAEPDYLRQVTRPFRDPRVGAVTTLFRGASDGSLGSEIESVSATADFCAGALAARCVEGVKFAHGATMATTRARLAEIGGFEALVNLHSDDYEFGARIAQHGYRIELLPHAVTMVYPSQTLREYILHELRWSIGLRNIRPWAHLGLVFTHGIFWAALAAITLGSWPAAAGVFGAYLGLRLWMVWEVGVRGVGDTVTRRNLHLIPLRDALAFAVWLASFFSKRIRWRGVEFTIENGRLVRAPRAQTLREKISSTGGAVDRFRIPD